MLEHIDLQQHTHTEAESHFDLDSELPTAPGFWLPEPPQSVSLGDHDVPVLGTELAGRQIALLICGGIAAMQAPVLARALRKHGARVTAFVSEQALNYVTLDALAWSTDRPVITQLSPRAEHLGDGIAYDAYLIAPATYNTINKCRQGIADGLITTVFAAALGRLEREQTPILMAPTMSGQMHNAILEESLIKLQELGVTVIPPRDAYGKHNLPEPESLVFQTARALSRSSLRNIPILVTGGPTPVALDQVRVLSNRFTGALSLEIAKALFVAGADVHWVHGPGPLQVPNWLPHYPIESFAEYQQSVMHLLAHHSCQAAILSAAVADYQPQSLHAGKLSSGQNQLQINLKPTAKVLQQVQADFPDLAILSFKFEANLSHAQLMQIAQSRLEQGSHAVIANRAEEQGAEQVAWLVEAESEPQRLQGKPQIACAIRDCLERYFQNQNLDFEVGF